MVTIRDVARVAGVSAGTVSNVLNRPSYVNAATRQRVRDAMVALDFHPTRSARQFRPGRERTLGLVMADMGNPFFVDVALAADAEARRLGVGVVIVTNGEDVLRERQNLDLLVQQRVHGIIISPVEESSPGLERLVRAGIPLVYVDRISGDQPCCWVTTDNRAGGRLAAEHLLGLGHRRLAFVGGRASPARSRAGGRASRRLPEAVGRNSNDCRPRGGPLRTAGAWPPSSRHAARTICPPQFSAPMTCWLSACRTS